MATNIEFGITFAGANTGFPIIGVLAWNDTNFLGQACEVMESNGTAIATFAFQQASSGGGLIPSGGTPWILNPIFANYTATNDLPPAPINQQFFEDYTTW